MGSALARFLAVALLLAACGSQSTPQAPPVIASAAGAGHGWKTFEVPPHHAWNLLWSYDCQGHGVFVADIFNADMTPDFKFPGVEEEGDRDSGVYHVLQSGRFFIEITTTCNWSVKVVELQS